MTSRVAAARRRLEQSCYLCADVARETDSSGIAIKYGADALDDSFLFESESLFVIPAPGTLVVGYLIVAPRWHVRSFAQLSVDELLTAERILRSAERHAETRGLQKYVFFEHGSASSYRVGAACIDHAHLHACPSPEPSEVRIILATFGLGLGEEIDGLGNLARVSSGSPYLLVGCAGTWFYYAVSDHLPSQLIRRVIARQIGEPDNWNWRVCPLPERFEQTRRLFKDCEWQ